MKIAVAGATGRIGSQLTALARREGHEVVELARETGFDLLAPAGLEEALAGAEAVVDVTACPLDQAGDFFPAVARNVGAAATTAGVRRSVVLSIVGVDRAPDYDYYVAKLAQEQAYRESAPGVVVLRATQFLEFAAQMMEWNTQDGVTQIIDVPTQPVATSEIVRLLLDLATGAVEGDVELAGPKVESLADQVRRLVAKTGADVRVETVDAPPSLAGGAMLPGPGALLRGPAWEEWLAGQ
ncbi:NAD(P)H-binding protein [Nocardioides sp. YIM 152315]|uniref:SDR family oxidoreductase n=1 Tax=Nocardioides sp. YIM 152315 TaxID=3031760 RepID=UPI0023DCD4EB|nr:NAD(P)H-binding protein [Nocardioides sp. YIM 152315]MDF1605155.1 NAD(P)H-binding protein [Nocardioides sp. YIM 152315]